MHIVLGVGQWILPKFAWIQYTDMRISQRKKLRPYPYFQGHIKIKTAKFRAKILKCTLSSYWVSWFFPKCAWIYYMDMTNLIFKDEAAFKPKYLNTHYLCSGSADFTQTCMILKSRHGKKRLKFWGPWHYFQGHIKRIAWFRWIIT